MGERFVDMNTTALFWGSLFPSSCVPADRLSNWRAKKNCGNRSRSGSLLVWFRRSVLVIWILVARIRCSRRI
jgi:hypothetical protein